MATPEARTAEQPANALSPIGEVTIVAFGWGEGKSEVRVQWPNEMQRGDAAAQARFLQQAISELTRILPSLPA